MITGQNETKEIYRKNIRKSETKKKIIEETKNKRTLNTGNETNN